MGTWERPGKSDDWYTPRYIFDALGCRFNLDVAAPLHGPRHVPAEFWLHERGLEADWRGFVWMNPPFGGRNGLTPWLDKFFAHGNGIALTPDRTSAPWWQVAAKKAHAILFIDGKVKFEMPCGEVGKQPGNGTTLMAAGAMGVLALQNASKAGLGLVMVRA